MSQNISDQIDMSLLKPNIEHPEFGWDVDCSADPYDMRPASKITLEAIKLKLQETQGRVVHVVIGEGHYYASHKAYKQLLLSMLIDAGIHVAVGVEAPDLELERAVQFNIKPSSDEQLNSVKKLARKYKYTGKETLAALATNVDNYAPHSQVSLLGFCWANRVSVSFNDLIGVFPERKSPGQQDEEISAILRGFSRRNAALVKNAKAHQSTVGAEVYLHFVGGAHVFGYSINGMPDFHAPTKESVVGIFDKSDMVLPVLLNAEYLLKTIPVEAAPLLKKAVLIRGLAGNRFDDNLHATDSDRLEIDCLEKIAKHSGNEIGVFRHAPLQRLARKEFRRMGREIKASLQL